MKLITVNESVIGYSLTMAPKAAATSRRQRGHVRKRGNSYQVLVYAGIDPRTGRPHYLTESTKDEKLVDRIMRRLLTEVDEQRNVQTKATLGAALDAWLAVHEVEQNTRKGYETHARLYIKPALGGVPLGKINAQMLELFYAQLRRCRIRCDGKVAIDHLVDGPHECRTVKHKRSPGRPRADGQHYCAKAGCVKIECPPHTCQPLSPSTIRQIHIAISAALSAAVRWEWIKTNPAAVAKKPRQSAPEPHPPSSEEAARILAAAWEQDDAWGTFVWLTLVTGMRRAELLALRWDDIDLTAGVVEIRRNYVWVKGRGVEKTTKTHRMRRISLDSATLDVLTAHHERCADDVLQLGEKPSARAFLFSHEPMCDRPYHPDAVTHRYTKMCAQLGIDSHLHALRHYSATELLTAGVDLRTVAGRLGHSGAGATTLRVYAAWVGAADRAAAELLGSRFDRPKRTPK
jgi:integrase